MSGALAFLRSREGLAVLALTAIGAAIRFATVGQQSYWYDEAVTASLVDGSLADLLSGVVDTESTPPLYYLAAWFWAQVVGSEEAALRSLSALIGTLLVPVAYAAGRIAATARVGLAAAALAAVSPMLIWYSQEARAYALVTLLGGLSFVAFLLAREQPTSRRLVAWAVVCALAVATHYFAAFVVAAEGLLLVLAHRRERRVWWTLGAVAAVGLALLPLAAVQASHRRLGWVGGIDVAERTREALQRLVTAATPSSWAGATGAEVTPYVWLSAVAVLAAAAVLVVLRGSARERTAATRAALVAAIGIGTPIAIALAADRVAGGDGDYFLDRNVLAAWLPLAVFVAAGLAAQRSGAFGAVCLAGVLSWSLVVHLRVVTSEELQRDDWRSVARALPADGRTAVVVYPAYQVDALTRQLPGLERHDRPEAVDRVVLVLVGFDEAPSSFRAPPGFDLAAEDEIQHFDLRTYANTDGAPIAPEGLTNGEPADADLGFLVAGAASR